MISNRTIVRLAIFAAVGGALSACGGGGSKTVTPPPQASFASMFGSGFGTDFGASSNSTPALLAGNELNPVSLSATPIPFPTGTVGTN